VVIVGWHEPTAPGGFKPGRWPLRAMTSLRTRTFECFAGRGASALLVLRRHGYQVNVMVGDRASDRLVAQALAIGRSFRLSR
jgi:hypothetical protein